jgi:hypothetical protein
MKGQEILNIKTKKKHSESSKQLAAHKQILKKQKQLSVRNHLSILKLNVNGHNSPIK